MSQHPKDMSRWPLLAGIASLLVFEARAQVPAIMSYQGRVLVGGSSFTGTGQFKFSLISSDGSQTYWQNAPDDNGDGQPDVAIAVGVSGGLFTVILGDTNVAGMAVLPPSVFTNVSVYLRIWFNDGTHGIQQLAPDQRVSSAPYAILAANIVDGAITPTKLASNTVSTVNAGLLARVDSLTAQLGTLSNQFTTLSNQYSSATPSGLTAASTDPLDASLGAKGFQQFSVVAPPQWVTSTAAGGPSARFAQCGGWTGHELFIWGGRLGGGGDSGSGGRYRPDLDEWQPVSLLKAPAARSQHTAVWSGSVMILWGGVSAGNYVNTGAQYNPSNDVWTSMSTNGAPEPRVGHMAVWTGNTMVIWGGRNNTGLLATGGVYNPASDQWVSLTLGNAPTPRTGATAVWTGSGLVVWGGANEQGGLSTGGQLLFSNGVPSTWISVNSSNAPSGRSGHAAIWTGQRMLVWGGNGGSVFLADGAAYDPIADAWSNMTANTAPSGRSAHEAVWTGQEMLVFGGETDAGTVGDGAAYNPASGQWRALSVAGNALPRSGATAAWSGTELLVFGGLANGQALGALQRVNPQPAWYLYRKP